MEIFPRPEDIIELNRFLVIISLIVFFSALLLWPLGWVFRRPALAKADSKPLAYKAIFSISRYVSLLMVMIALLVYFFLSKHSELIDTLNFPGIDEAAGVWLNIFYSLPSFLVILFPLQLILLILVWTGQHGTQIFRIHFSLVSAALLTFILFLIAWNLVVPGYYFSVLF
ncbi:MAG: hypothetical protein U9N86_00315 [Bacteroidota bacterium]|nr:hypothetical protein [Bacteroidota bacterium]